ncbi:DUF4136 domain-containing protein [Massilia glaciei]|uniref:DUF4136 domain-containing protein n=1 Tax=Massilia glaciei TaxID=1524097 RepID=A0A2U2HNE8_9BURK|nr:DUF4136 domain-containing protein [Massilia glaciei]PWF48956.1 DUF4136 domain-containing protein [Massilia glaciei]
MKRPVLIAIAALTLLLGGCASTIQSDVTAFHEWPAELPNKTYVFEAPPVQQDTLEMRSYRNLVRAELARLGFQDAPAGAAPALRVALKVSTTDVATRALQISDPFFTPFYSPFYSSYYRMARGVYMPASPHRHIFFGHGFGYRFSPFYSSYMFGMPQYEESIRHTYKRELNVAIRAAASGKPMFDVTVQNSSRQRSTPRIMPALVRSAFESFPGPSGVARRVELTLAETPAPAAKQ